ncbi:hypothetical protein [Streptomyces sp. NPDC002785]|uniref:hypothetical protein n=1 Tax=Streptomyces sp. NPDC002785 TaxID=3154543 RepID=UPI00332CADB7
MVQTLTAAGELQRDLQRELTYDGPRAAEAKGSKGGRRPAIPAANEMTVDERLDAQQQCPVPAGCVRAQPAENFVDQHTEQVHDATGHQLAGARRVVSGAVHEPGQEGRE